MSRAAGTRARKRPTKGLDYSIDHAFLEKQLKVLNEGSDPKASAKQIIAFIESQGTDPILVEDSWIKQYHTGGICTNCIVQ